MAVNVRSEQVNIIPEVMDAEQVAEMLGICKQNVYELCRTKKIPHKRVSPRRIIFSRMAIEKWLNECE